jgi:hypothetical protein
MIQVTMKKNVYNIIAREEMILYERFGEDYDEVSHLLSFLSFDGEVGLLSGIHPIKCRC